MLVFSFFALAENFGDYFINLMKFDRRMYLHISSVTVIIFSDIAINGVAAVAIAFIFCLTNLVFLSYFRLGLVQKGEC